MALGAAVLAGDAGWPATKRVADVAENYLWTPLPSAEVAAKPRYHVKHWTMGQVPLTCAQSAAISPQLGEDAVTLMAQDENLVPTTCFADGGELGRIDGGDEQDRGI